MKQWISLWRERILFAHRDESGLSSYFLGMALAVGLLALMVIFSTFMSLYASRRMAQTSVDAAALAAAEEYARQLSVTYPQPAEMGFCAEPVESVRMRAVGRYAGFVMSIGNRREIGLGIATDYANQNHAPLDVGDFSVRYPFSYSDVATRYVEGYVFEKVMVSGTASRDFQPSGSARPQSVPAQSRAIVHMFRQPERTEWFVPCGEEEIQWYVQYTYHWRITLIKPR